MNLLPKKPTFQNFIDAFKNVPLLRFIGNSFLVASLITVGYNDDCRCCHDYYSFNINFYRRTEAIDSRYVLRSRKGLTVYIKANIFYKNSKVFAVCSTPVSAL